MIYAAHQPNYVPWLGYFYKMAWCDVFVYLDTCQYPTGGFANRNRIKGSSGPIWLTIPISRPSLNSTYADAKFADPRWKTKHLKTLDANYKQSPHFEEIFELYRAELGRHEEFVALNIGLIETFAEYLGIRCKRVRLSDLGGRFGRRTRMLADIGKALGADTYLSGSGGAREYQDEKLFRENRIMLKYSDFVHPVYPQLWGPFIQKLSILDLLFNCGQNSTRILKVDASSCV